MYKKLPLLQFMNPVPAHFICPQASILKIHQQREKYTQLKSDNALATSLDLAERSPSRKPTTMATPLAPV
jgi:hypothetical protein